MFNKKSKQLLGFAKENRREYTKSEDLLWQQLRRKQLGVKFRRQYVFDKYILDFYCANPKICIEIDGSTHEGLRIQKDKDRDEYIKEYGVEVFRFDDQYVINNVEGVLTVIKEYIKNDTRIDV